MNLARQPDEFSQIIPPEIPALPDEAVESSSVTVPMVYERISVRMEYKVAQCDSLEPARLQAELNAFSREDWWLVQIVPLERQALLILARSVQSKG
jgi:hypothetical protein